MQRIRATNARVAMDAFSKIPCMIAPTIRDRLGRDESIDSVAMLPALFLALLERWHSGDLPYTYHDQSMDETVAHAICAAANPIEAYAANASLWGLLAGDWRLIDALSRARQRVMKLVQSANR